MEVTSLIFFVLIVVAYLLGSISTAIVVCKLMALPDPRTEGSNNPGATNVLRLGGKKAAAITLAGDALKGLIPVLIGHMLDLPLTLLGLVGFAAFLGHLYPVFFQFRGGKGVATAFGAILGISWLTGGLVLFTWLFVAWLSKISSLSALIAATLAPFYFWMVTANFQLTIVSLAMSIMLILRHRSNILKLIEGTED